MLACQNPKKFVHAANSYMQRAPLRIGMPWPRARHPLSFTHARAAAPGRGLLCGVAFLGTLTRRTQWEFIASFAQPEFSPTEKTYMKIYKN